MTHVRHTTLPGHPIAQMDTWRRIFQRGCGGASTIGRGAKDSLADLISERTTGAETFWAVGTIWKVIQISSAGYGCLPGQRNTHGQSSCRSTSGTDRTTGTWAAKHARLFKTALNQIFRNDRFSCAATSEHAPGPCIEFKRTSAALGATASRGGRTKHVSSKASQTGKWSLKKIPLRRVRALIRGMNTLTPLSVNYSSP